MDNPLFLFIGALLQTEAVAAMILILMVVILLLCRARSCRIPHLLRSEK